MDKTAIVFNKIKQLLSEEVSDVDFVNLPKLISELEYLLKVTSIQRQVTMAQAARMIGMNRTTLYEYIKNKLNMTPAEVKEIDLSKWHF